jgi:hypothetical protein
MQKKTILKEKRKMKNTWIKILCLMVALMAMFTFVACDNDDDDLGLGGNGGTQSSTPAGDESSTDEGNGGNGGTTESKCNGVDVHDYGKWLWQEATCTSAKTGTRECTTCGWIDTITQGEVAGHAYGTYQAAAGGKRATCEVCGKADVISFTNVASNASEITLTGAYGTGSLGVLTDGRWTIPFTVAPTGGAVTITFVFATPVDVDQISYLGSAGAGTYQVTATLQNGEEKVLGTVGGGGQAAWGDTTGPIGTMDQSANATNLSLAETVSGVVEIVFYAQSSSQGTDAIGEVAIYTDPTKQAQ